MSEIDKYALLPALRGCLYGLCGLPCALLPSESGSEADAGQLTVKLADDPGSFSLETFAPKYEAWKSRMLRDYEVGRYASDVYALMPHGVNLVHSEFRVSGEVGFVGEAITVHSRSKPADTAAIIAVKKEMGYSGLKGRVALVTGAAQGFGKEIATDLVRAGSVVFLADINEDGAEKLSARLNDEQGCRCAYPLFADVTDEAAVEKMCKEMIDRVGGIDLCVSNAGVLKASSVFDENMDDFRYVTNVNYIAFAIIVKYVSRIMRIQFQNAPDAFYDIIQINSRSGLTGSNKNGSYAGSKFGSLGLIQSYAMELAAYHIKVNGICPGDFLDGPLWSKPGDGLLSQYLHLNKVPGATTVEEVRRHYESRVPMGRGCKGQDVYKAIRYLVDQCYETGQALPVTGGRIMLN